MKEEEKRAIEYLKSRLYGNEGCNYIDVAQEDLRIFINLIDRKEKDIEGWKKYCEEIEEEKTEMNNKNCELEFKVEKLQKENEELKKIYKSEKKMKNEYVKLYQDLLLEENVIPIQNVKEKIEKLQYEKGEYYSQYKIDELNDKIQVLQELLEGRKEREE